MTNFLVRWDCPGFTIESSKSWETPLSQETQDDCHPLRDAWPVGVTRSSSQWLGGKEGKREGEGTGLRQGTLLKDREWRGEMRSLGVS